jgi:hypothetical protein
LSPDQLAEDSESEVTERRYGGAGCALRTDQAEFPAVERARSAKQIPARSRAIIFQIKTV